MNEAQPYRHGDAFAGIGGFGLAARNVGWRTVWAAEIEPSARSVYAARLGHPELRFDTDIRESRDLPAIDVLTGGFPCQDLSVAGKRKGLAGGRSGLFFELVRILEEARPEWFVFENVPGLLSSHGGRDMAVVLSSLVDCGYGVAFRVLNSQFFGVAQRRRRVFIVGHSSGDERRAAEVLLIPEGVRRDSPAISKAGSDVAGTLEASFGDWSRNEPGAGVVAPLTQRPYGDGATDDPPLVAGALSGVGPGGGWRFGADEAARNQLVAHTLSAEGFDASEDGSGRGTPLVANTLRCGGMADSKHAAGSSIDNTPVIYQCHGSNVGPIGSLRAGNGNESGGVPFLATEGARAEDLDAGFGRGGDVRSSDLLRGVALSENQRGEIRLSDISPAINQPGGKAGQGYACVAFNPQAGGSVDYVGGRNPYTDALTRHQTPGVLCPPPDPSGVRTSAGLSGSLDLCPSCIEGPDAPRYRSLGNAVTRNTVEWILRRIEQQRRRVQ